MSVMRRPSARIVRVFVTVLFFCHIYVGYCAQDSSPIYFQQDDTNPTLSPPRFSPRPSPTTCNDTLQCAAIGYPSQHVARLLQRQGTRLARWLGVDRLVARPPVIGQRVGAAGAGEMPMCRAAEKVVTPQVGMNKDDQWFFIVNQEPYVQGVRVEVCEKEQSPCAFGESFPLKTECKQKYIYRKMLVVSRDNGEADVESIRLPSCCTCTILKPEE